MNAVYENKDYSKAENVEYALNNAIPDGICAVTLIARDVEPSALDDILTGYATLEQFSIFGQHFTKIQNENPTCLKTAYAAASTFKKMAALWGDPAGKDLAKRAEDNFLAVLDKFLEQQTSLNHSYMTLNELFEHVSSGLGVSSFEQEITARHEQHNYLYRSDQRTDFDRIKNNKFKAKRWQGAKDDFQHKLLKEVIKNAPEGHGLYRICFCEDELSGENNWNDAYDASKAQHATKPHEAPIPLMLRVPRQVVLDLKFTENVDEEYSRSKIKARMYYKLEKSSGTNQDFSDSGIPFSAFEIYINGSWQSLQAWIQAQNAAAIAQQQQQQPAHNNSHGKSGSLLQKIANVFGLGR